MITCNFQYFAIPILGLTTLIIYEKNNGPISKKKEGPDCRKNIGSSV